MDYTLFKENGFFSIISAEEDTQRIHINHVPEYTDIVDDEYNKFFVVFEQFPNYPRLHLVSASDKDDALGVIVDYVQSEEEFYPTISSIHPLVVGAV